MDGIGRFTLLFTAIWQKLNRNKKNEFKITNNVVLEQENEDFYDKKINRYKKDIITHDHKKDFKILAADLNAHLKAIEDLKEQFPNIRVMDRRTIRKNFNIDDFLDIKDKYANKETTAEESALLIKAKEKCLLPAITIEKSETFNGEKKIIYKGGKKALGIVYPTAEMLEFEFEEIFLIDFSVIDDIWGTKTLSFGDSAGENMEQILNYMETDNISDFHIFLHDDSTYTFTARQKTKVIKINNNRVDSSSVKSLLTQLLYKANRDTQFNGEEEVRGLIKERMNDGNHRNFRLHIRESTYNNTRGVSISIRLLPREDQLGDISTLGYQQNAVNLIKNVLLKHKDGVIIVSGPTNSGKTTLLNSVLVFLRDVVGLRIHRIENPAEVALKDVVTFDLMDRRGALNPPTLTDFMDSIFSQDPDVALIGEARNDEELATAFKLAKTGHLALVTLHAKDNTSAVSRMIEAQGIDKKEFNDKVRLAINQYLIGKTCNVCQGKNQKEADNCPKCGGSRISDVLPVYELSLYHKLDKDDDINDIEKLTKEGKLIYISKADILDIYKERGWITDGQYKDLNVKDINEFLNDVDD